MVDAFGESQVVSSWLCPFGHDRQNKQQQTEDPVFRHLRRAQDKSRDKHTVIWLNDSWLSQVYTMCVVWRACAYLKKVNLVWLYIESRPAISSGLPVAKQLSQHLTFPRLNYGGRVGQRGSGPAHPSSVHHFFHPIISVA